ncbi:MAG: replicative DNA helicase [Candidatus Limnocylindria bacterium]
MSIDKLAPQAVEAEQSVLGSILIDADAILRVGDFLKPADFYRAQHADVYEAMLALHGQREPIDLVTLGDELRRRDKLDAIGGPAYLTSLMNAVPTAVHAEHYGRIVERKAVLRNLIGAAGKIAAVGYEEANDAEVAIDRAESILFEISQRRTDGGFESLSILLGQAYDRLEYLHEHRGQILGVPTGLGQLDALLGGFQPSDLVILAARPSVGKTSLALNVAQHAAVRETKKVAVFSLEMSKEQLALRLLSAESGINPRPLQTGFVDETDWSKIAMVMNDMATAPMWIDDSPALSVMELRTKARRLEAEQRGLDLIIVDYLQLMQASTPNKDSNRVQEVSEISRGLKQLARELKVPVVALSQLSRGVEQRGTAEPRLSDLRESGCLTADTRVLRADSGEQMTMGELLESGERNIPVWSMDHRQKLVRSTMTHVFPSGTKPVFLLRLASGRRLRATANHRFFSFDGWLPLAELTVGTRIAVAKPNAMRERGVERDSFLAAAGTSHRAYRSAPTRERVIALAEALDNEDLALTADSDVSWDAIVEISPAGVEPVYDATVLETHNFLAEGIVSHNSIEQDADVVIFLYRDGEQNPEAEVELIKAKVAKHRNGPIGEVPLQFRKANTRFYTVAAREEIAAY